MLLKKLSMAMLGIVLGSTLIIGCSRGDNNKTPEEKVIPSLKEVYSDYFPIGAAVTPEGLTRFDELLKKHFNSLTAENVMKFSEIQPSEGVFTFEKADKIVDYAQNNDMLVRGHTLAWHEQVPRWIFVGPDGTEASKELVLERLENHIKTVVGRYKGKVYAWDVVNEAIDDGSLVLRDTPWTKITGDEFIKKAFQWTHEVDPDAKLFYNDYSLENPAKREKAYNLLKELIEEGIPVTGVGLQGHYALNWPSIKDIEDTILKFASLGLEVHITELDMSYYAWDDTSKKYEAAGGEPEELQATRYGQMFEVFRRHKDVVTNVTFWGVTDDTSWLNYTPVQGRSNWPLLFDSNMNPKKPFWSVVEF